VLGGSPPAGFAPRPRPGAPGRFDSIPIAPLILFFVPREFPPLTHNLSWREPCVPCPHRPRRAPLEER
jgi:hypothetical protein